MHHEELVFDMCVFFSDTFVVPFDQIRHIIVDKSFNRIYHALIYLMSDHSAVRCYLHIYRQCQPVLVWIEAADTVRQRLRQHRDHLIQQIHTRSPLKRLLIQRAVFFHVMSHISDMDAQQIVAVIKQLYRYRIVKIL